MPKALFFEINPQKKERILEAAIREFSSRKYVEASINQIVKEADISRGSFYQYFEDKDDLYFYIISTVVNETAYAFLKDFLSSQPDDIFAVYEAMFTYNLHLLSDQKYQAFFKNMYLGLDYHLQQKLKEIFSDIRAEILEGNLNELRIKSGYDNLGFQELMNILELSNRDLLMQFIVHPLGESAIMDAYQRRIQILRGINNTKTKEA
jgi:AcrR family transcriptional regulator